ncbi:Protoheme IX farnesyltransferase, mitochondrial [Mucor velutinosus]|uniref:Protoheme IX farnesyltransferase, mitochondrial n=1 Tax=Mucor velutinosus TaxID=708070 RepID=A0AAN7DAR4_9FUNG|nr:Protoheme IX farnesyltransferase, mitochondrial [Mucor velutinosus]
MQTTFIIIAVIATLLLATTYHAFAATIATEMKAMYKWRLIAGPGSVVDAVPVAVSVKNTGEKFDAALDEEAVNIRDRL